MSPLHASVVVCLVWCRVVEPECVSALFNTLMDAQFSVDHASEAQTSIKVRLPPPLLTGPHLHAATNATPCSSCPSSLVVTPVSVVCVAGARPAGPCAPVPVPGPCALDAHVRGGGGGLLPQGPGKQGEQGRERSRGSEWVAGRPSLPKSQSPLLQAAWPLLTRQAAML